jgi:pSer/pThr/pTyr-binding forkhead associated (FHA) protein
MIYADLRNVAEPKVLERPLLSPQPTATLIIKPTGSDIGGTVFHLGENTSIGRSEHNDIVVTGSFVSHEHACITYHKNQYLLSDLGSTNGTYLNDEKVIAEVTLKDGDVIKIGAVTFKFER